MGEHHPDPIDSIEVLEFASPPRAFTDQVVEGLGRGLSVPCRLRTSALMVDVPYLPGRNQADADRLLERVESCAKAKGEVLVAVTNLDIGHPIFTHFFGRARHGGRAALVSTARLTPVFYGLPADEAVAVRRTVLEILHELGHVVGLGHCQDYGCLMRFAPVVEQIDNRGRTFCAVCSERVPGSLGPSRTPRDG